MILNELERNSLWKEWLPKLRECPEDIKQSVFLKTDNGCAMCGHREERVIFGKQLFTYDPCPVCA